MKGWEPTKYKCKDCGDVIWSERPGQFMACSCGGSFVDQTRHYVRFGGSLELFEEDVNASIKK